MTTPVSTNFLTSNPYTYEAVQSMAEHILAKVGKEDMLERPEIMIICGSGLQALGNSVENPVSISYEDIPNFPRSTGMKMRRSKSSRLQTHPNVLFQ